MYPKFPSVQFLIENYSKARVIKAAPVNELSRLLGKREICDRDVVDSMLRKYAK